MSNVDLVAGWYEETGEWTPATVEWWAQNVWHPDIEWRAIDGAPDDVGLMKGQDRLRRYYGEWLELFEGIKHEVLTREAVGELVVLGMRVTACSRSTGMPLDLVYAVVHELGDDGRLVRGNEYATVEEALGAAAQSRRGVSDFPKP